MSDIDNHLRQAIDFAAMTSLIGVLMSWLPNIAAVFTALWAAVRAYNEVMLAVHRHQDRKHNQRKFRRPDAL